jgi:hypothetical protein
LQRRTGRRRIHVTMTQDLTRLIEYLDRRFGAIDEQLGAVGRRMEELRSEFDVLQTSVDAYAKRADAYFQEMVVLTHTVHRHERWLQQIARQLGITLEY